MADSKQKCLNRIIGDTRIGMFLFRGKWSGIYFFHLKSEKLIDFEHKRGVPEKGKTENLKRKASRFDWRILYNICTSLLPTCPP